MADQSGDGGPGRKPDDAGVEQSARADGSSGSSNSSVRWLADYVYGTISTLVAIAGLTWENNPGALTTAGVVVIGAVAIWFAHALSRIVTMQSWQHLTLKRSDVTSQLRGSWSIVTAAIPATVVFILAGLHLWVVKPTAFTIAEIVGVLSLAVVAVGTTGGRGLSVLRRTVYVVALVSVGVMIVLLELLVHLL